MNMYTTRVCVLVGEWTQAQTGVPWTSHDGGRTRASPKSIESTPLWKGLTGVLRSSRPSKAPGTSTRHAIGKQPRTRRGGDQTHLLFALSTSDTPRLLVWDPSCGADAPAVVPVDGRILITSSPALQHRAAAASREVEEPNKTHTRLRLPFSGSRLGRRVNRSVGSGVLGASIHDMRSSSLPPLPGTSRLCKDLCMVAKDFVLTKRTFHARPRDSPRVGRARPRRRAVAALSEHLHSVCAPEYCSIDGQFWRPAPCRKFRKTGLCFLDFVNCICSRNDKITLSRR
jgi:hypothetical protein